MPARPGAPWGAREPLRPARRSLGVGYPLGDGHRDALDPNGTPHPTRKESPMDPIARRLRPALLAVAFACAIALTGVIVEGPHSGHAGAVLGGAFPAGIANQWPRKYGSGVVLAGIV